MKLKVLAIVLLLVVAGAAVAVAIGALPGSSAAAVTYLTAPATVTNVSDDVAATGSVASSTAWDLSFGSTPASSDPSAASSSSASSSTPTTTDSDSWSVTDVKVKVGDVVKAKQALASATNSTLAADVAAAKKDVESANLQLLNAQDSYNAATQTAQIRQTHAQLLSAQNALAQASSKYRDLRTTAARGELVAPAAGTVTAVNVQKGAMAPTGAAITIAAGSYQVTANVVETDVARIQIGQAADVSVAAINADLTGTVAAIAPTAESSSSSGSVVSYAVTIDLAAPPPATRAGMTANVTVTTASASNVLAVPAAALRGTEGNYSVLVLVDGVPQAQPVTVGLITSSLVEIKSGLNQGDDVVIGTSSQQRTGTTSGFGPGGGGFVVNGGGGGRFNGGKGGGN